MPQSPNYQLLPEHIRDGMQLYIEQGIPPGGFLMAVLENNLVEAFGRADLINRHAMFEITGFIYNEAPSNCWGSPEKVTAWIERWSR